jgi:hypothetical protein
MRESRAELEVPLVDPALQLYLPTILIELLIFLLITLVLKRGGESLRSIGWGVFNLRNLFIGVGFLIFANAILLTLSLILKINPAKEIEFLLPRRRPDSGDMF